LPVLSKIMSNTSAGPSHDKESYKLFLAKNNFCLAKLYNIMGNIFS
jgi:hypothetical protein